MTFFHPVGRKISGLRHRSTMNSLALPFITRPLIQIHRPVSIISLLIGAILIFTLSLKENRAVYHLNLLLLDLTSPLVDVVTQPISALTAWSDFLRTHQSLRTEVSLLKEENTHLTSQVHQLRQQVLDHQDLIPLVHAIPDPKIGRITTRVVGRPTDGISSLLIIKATQKDGVEKNYPVVTGEGVLGRVSEVSYAFSRILPITDLSSRIPVEIESSREHAIVAGQNSDELRLIHMEKQTKIKIGDRLVTSGYGGIFPRGLPVAIVTSVEGDTIKARPFAKKDPAFVTVLFTL